MKKRLHTESEYLNFNQTMVYSLAQLYRKNQDNFYSFVDHLPTYIVLNDKKSLYYKYANSVSLKTLEIDDYNYMSYNAIQLKSDPYLLKLAFKKIQLFDKINDQESICSTIQRLHFNKKMNWIFGNKAIINDETYLNNYYELKELYIIGDKISQILKPLENSVENWQKFQSLTKKEKILLKLITIGKSNKEISEQLFISEHTVRTHREKIRKKIDAHNLYEMIKFAEAFDLIGAL